MGKDSIQMALIKLDSHLQKSKVGSLHRIQKLTQIISLTCILRAKTIKYKILRTKQSKRYIALNLAIDS